MEQPNDWSIEADQDNRIQMERVPITVSQIHEATRGDPVLSHIYIALCMAGQRKIAFQTS